VLLESWRHAKNPFVQKGGSAPLDGFLDLGTGFAHDVANGGEDGLGEIGGLRDIGVDALVFVLRFCGAGRHGGIFSAFSKNGTRRKRSGRNKAKL
jgi:hypothetical protein